MLVRNEMTKKVECVDPETSVKEVARKMKELNIGAVPVCENGRPVGIVTDRDITIRLTAKAKDPRIVKVKEIMSSQVEWCYEYEEVEDVVGRMEREKIRRLPVVNTEKKIVGMLSLGDMAVRGSRMAACEVLEKVSAPA